MSKNEAIKATVKSDGRKIQVYKLKDGRYNIYLGEHNESFNVNELNF